MERWSNIYHLGVKELRILIRDPVLQNHFVMQKPT